MALAELDLYRWRSKPVHVIKFESAERILGLQTISQPFSTSIGSWRISEIYRPDVHSSLRPGLGSYAVVLEADVASTEELLDLHYDGVTLCEELEPVWLYVWGTPLHGFGWGVRVEITRSAQRMVDQL